LPIREALAGAIEVINPSATPAAARAALKRAMSEAMASSPV
jgi:hypothetical protein